MNYPLPPEPAPNEPLRASWGVQLIRWARANTLLPTPGMLLSRTGNGTSFRPQTAPAPAPAAAAAAMPWQPYLSLWTGTGPDPDADTRVLRFRLNDGQINSRTPGNMTDELVAFGDPTDAEIEVQDAVITCVYLQIPVSESSLGSGDLQTARPTIMLVEGAPTADSDEAGQESTDLLDALTNNGTVPPAFGDDGSLPAYIVIGLFAAYWWGGNLTFGPGIANNLFVSLANGGNCASTSRNFAVTSA